MTSGPILITSFQPWRSHQKTNSSDDLIEAIAAHKQLPKDIIWLRQLPVNFQTASIRVISEMQRLRPRAVICCGMAESRAYLSIESQAKGRSKGRFSVLKTPANIADLMTDTVLSEVSNDAGSYVCNRLYYDVLQFIQKSNWETIGLFVHVPIVSEENKPYLLNDFATVVRKITFQSSFQ